MESGRLTRRGAVIIGLSFTAGILAGWALVATLRRVDPVNWWPWAVGIIILVVGILADLGWIVTRPRHP